MSKQSEAVHRIDLREADAASVRSRVEGSTLYMKAYYKKEAEAVMPSIGGKWDEVTTEWGFPIARLDEVMATYITYYGTSGIKSESTVNAIIVMDEFIKTGLSMHTELGNSGRYNLNLLSIIPVVSHDPRRGTEEIQPLLGVRGTEDAFYLDKSDPAGLQIRPKAGTILSIDNLNMRATLRRVADSLNARKLADTTAVLLYGGDLDTSPMPIRKPRPSAPIPAPRAATPVASSGSSGSSGSSSDPITYDMADKSTKMAYLNMQLMVKALATRAAQLPDDVVSGLLAQAGLKRTR